MRLTRTLLSVLIALAVALGPVAAAKAAAHGSNTASMTDCDKAAKTMSTPAGDGCCCDSKMGCPSSQCLLKCFKIVGAAPASQHLLHIRLAHVRPADPVRPPDWLDQPRPPPPRV